jgi:hypothetical protein
LCLVSALKHVGAHWCFLGPQVVDGPPGISPKRRLDGEKVFQHKVKRQVQVLELPDIQKEFELVNARLRLIKHSPDLCSSVGKLINFHLRPIILTG